MIPSPTRLALLAATLLSATLPAACGAPRDDGIETGRDAVPATSEPRIVFMGTSLTAGYGLADPSLAYPALIQQRLDAAGLHYRVVNAGVSGATSADLRQAADWVLRQPAAVLVVEAGANDGLRGLDVDSLRANLTAILARARRQSPPPRLVVIGMEAPPNYGPRYTGRFRAVFPEVARADGAALVPFLLAGVGGVDSLNQADGVHPTAVGQRILADNVWQVLEPLLR